MYPYQFLLQNNKSSKSNSDFRSFSKRVLIFEVKRWIFLILAAFWTLVLSVPLGPLPRGLGFILDPHRGLWRHQGFEWRDRELQGLKNSVFVAIDEHGVPHLFAENEPDLFLAQGYVVGSQRAFQMDLSTRISEGRLTEFFGPRALESDRFFVKLGMRQSSEKILKVFESDPVSGMILNSFVDGVNEAFKSLETQPPEYAFFGQTLEAYSAKRVVNFARTINFNLTGRSYDLYLTAVQKKLGTAKALDLFPEFLPGEFENYVIPDSETKALRRPETAKDHPFVTGLEKFPPVLQPVASNGSNNWAVSADHSTTGHSMMANDTHLGLSLPNIWFEIQLQAPGINAYGFAIPPFPGILAGFNQDLAWGLTNGTTDAHDWYEVEFENETSMNYRYGDSFVAAEVFNEEIRGPGGRGNESVEVVWTRYGVLMYREGKRGLVSHWLGHEIGNGIKVMRELTSAKSAAECVRTLREWNHPLHNFVCVDQKNVALTHAGYLPLRKIGEGRFVQNAADFPSPLSQTIPLSDRPLEVNPRRGYVGSSNQRVVGPSYPYYLGWDYEEPWRAMAVRRLLDAKPKLSPEDMIAILNDNFDPQAEAALPVLLKLIVRERLSRQQLDWVEKLDKWDHVVLADDVLPTIYKSWWTELKKALFNDDYDQPERRFYPKDMRVLWMLKRLAANPADPDGFWADDQTTEPKESIQDIVTIAFNHAWGGLEGTYGRSPERWTWKSMMPTKLNHIAGIPGFGSAELAVDGAGESVKATKGRHGPVHRVVVEMSDWPKAWVQVPGGNSGDPFDRAYGRGVDEWVKGQMREAQFYKNLDEAKRRAIKIVELKPEGAK